MVEIYIRNGETDKAVEQMEILHKQFPEFPKEAIDYYDKTLSFLKKKDKDNAVIQFTIFHNYLKVTSPYQAGIMDLKGTGGSLIGFPLITFDQQSSSPLVENGSLLDVIKFTDVSESAGLDVVPLSGRRNSEFRYSPMWKLMTMMATVMLTFMRGVMIAATSSYKHYLFNNEMGRFNDVSEAAASDIQERNHQLLLPIMIMMGFSNLYIVNEGGDILYRNTGKGTFEDVTGKAGIGSQNRWKYGLIL